MKREMYREGDSIGTIAVEAENGEDMRGEIGDGGEMGFEKKPTTFQPFFLL